MIFIIIVFYYDVIVNFSCFDEITRHVYVEISFLHIDMKNKSYI